MKNEKSNKKIEVGNKVERKNPKIIEAWKTGKVERIEDGKAWLDYCPPYGVRYTNNPVPIENLRVIEE